MVKRHPKYCTFDANRCVALQNICCKVTAMSLLNRPAINGPPSTMKWGVQYYASWSAIVQRNARKGHKSLIRKLMDWTAVRHRYGVFISRFRRWGLDYEPDRSRGQRTELTLRFAAGRHDPLNPHVRH
jgi:hypothetical protein